MTDEYTPTTEQVRESYIWDRWNGGPAFDRWLTQVIAEAKAEALWDAANAAEDSDPIEHPFVGLDEFTAWLRNRAASETEGKPCTCGWGGQHDPDNPRCEKNGATYDWAASETEGEQ